MTQFRKKPVVIEATQWFKNGDHPDDRCEQFTNGLGEPFMGEGHVVRYFRHPGVDGERPCEHCGTRMHEHGWIDTLEGGHNVCPGDWIITGIKGERYPCKPDIFEATYELAASPASPAAQPEKLLTEVVASMRANVKNPDEPPDHIYGWRVDEWADDIQKWIDQIASADMNQSPVAASPAAAEWREHQEIFVAAIRTLREQSCVESNCMASSFAYRENQHTFMVQLDDALAIIDEPPASPLAATLEHK